MRAAPALTFVMLATLMLVPVHDAPQQTFQQQPLPKIAPAPEFSLTSQDGGRVTLADLRGKVVAVTFIYTLCTSTCPVLTPTMSFVQDQLGPNFGTKIAFVSITVDPERDTPQVLKRVRACIRRQSRGLGLPHRDPGRYSGRHASLRCVCVEDRERRRGPHVSYIDRRSIWNPTGPICRSALRPG
jgi:protein SCO1